VALDPQLWWSTWRSPIGSFYVESGNEVEDDMTKLVWSEILVG
jgi:hypothetical protein